MGVADDSLIVAQHETVTKRTATSCSLLSIGAIKEKRHKENFSEKITQILEQNVTVNTLWIPSSVEAQHRKLREG